MMERPAGNVYAQPHQQPPPDTSPYQQPPPQQYGAYPAHVAQPPQQGQVHYQPGPYDDQWAQFYAAQAAAATSAQQQPAQSVSPNQNQFAAAAGVPQYAYGQTSPYAQGTSPYGQPGQTAAAPLQTHSHAQHSQNDLNVNVVGATPVSPPPHAAHLGSSTSLDHQFHNVGIHDQYGGQAHAQAHQQPHYPVQQ